MGESKRMKKSIRLLLLMAVITALLCITAFAAAPTEAGMYNVSKVDTHVTELVPLLENGNEATNAAPQPTINGTAATNFYAGAVKLIQHSRRKAHAGNRRGGVFASNDN